jgi:hypothetical protein
LARIFLALSLFALSLLIVNIVLGLRIGGFNSLWSEYSAAARKLEGGNAADSDRLTKQLAFKAAALAKARDRKTLHFLFGVAGSLVTVLVSSVSVTYFVGTSRWCREVVETYRLDAELAERSRRLKRRTFPWALLSTAAILAIIALGASADPSVAPEQAAKFVSAHYLAALVGVAVIAWSFFVQLGNVAANYEIIDSIVAEVTRIRREKGLD